MVAVAGTPASVGARFPPNPPPGGAMRRSIRSVWVASSEPLLGSTVTKSPRDPPSPPLGDARLGQARQVHFHHGTTIGVHKDVARQRANAQGGAIGTTPNKPGIEDLNFRSGVEATDMATAHLCDIQRAAVRSGRQ